MSSASRLMPRMKRTAGAALALVCLGVGAILFVVGQSTDRESHDQEVALVERRIERMLDKTVEDIASATIWNEAVAAFAGPEPDLAWTQVNFGDYYADYMDHALTLTYGVDGALIQVSRDSEPVAAETEAAFVEAVAPLVRDLRRAAPEYARNFGFEAVLSRRGLIEADGRLYLVGATTVVPEDETAPRLAAPPVVVSARPMDSLVQSLSRDLGLRDVTLGGAGAAGVQLRDIDGDTIGFVAWTPDRPGREVLMSAGPLLLILMLALAGVAAVLWRRIDEAVRRLTESEAALAEALDEARAASDAKSRFLSTMSHELRTPLNGVLGMAEVLEMGELDTRQRGQLSLLKESGQTLLALIEGILDVARLDRRHIVLNPAPFSPDALITEIAAEFAGRARFKGLELRLRAEAPAARLGDRGQLAKAFKALVQNAVTFTSEGSVCLTARETEDGLVLEVEDTGPGLGPDQVERLLKPFSQGDESSTRTVGGAGLGLAISRGLIEAMGGQLEIDSEPGRGSTFRAVLPLPLADLERRAA